jgi:N-carbamoylputrescine amidase
MKFTVALLQILPRGMDQEYNRRKGIEWCRKAKERGADLVLFPEMWNVGYAACPLDKAGKEQWEASAIDQSSDFFQSFVELAQELHLNIALTYLEKRDPKPRNTVSIINNQGEVVLNYSKVFICDFGKEELEKEHPNLNEVGCDYACAPGNAFEVCALQTNEGAVSIGAMICADREFPEAAGELMLKGAELIIVPNACTWDELRGTQLKVRAFENFVGIAMANYPSPKDNGHSSAYHCVTWDRQGNPQNTKIVEAGEEEGLYLATFDLDAIRDFQQREKWRLDYRKSKEKTMPPEVVASLYADLAAAGVPIWIDGGWSVDALIGRQTRRHKDLDIAVEWNDVPTLRELFAARGYKEVRQDSQWNFVLADDHHHEIDVHAFVRDEQGQIIDGVMYPPESLIGQGMINGQPVRCIAAKYMVQFIAPWLYKLRDKDFHDVAVLCEKFGIAYPAEYKRGE